MSTAAYKYSYAAFYYEEIKGCRRVEIRKKQFAKISDDFVAHFSIGVSYAYALCSEKVRRSPKLNCCVGVWLSSLNTGSLQPSDLVTLCRAVVLSAWLEHAQLTR